MNRIKEICQSRGIDQKTLALDVGVSQPTVSDWWNQKKSPRGERLEKLSEILGMSKAEILGFEPIANLSAQASGATKADKAIAAELAALSPAEKDNVLAYIRFLKSSK